MIDNSTIACVNTTNTVRYGEVNDYGIKLGMGISDSTAGTDCR